MKRLAFTGLTVILVLFLAACGGEMSGVAPSGVEYTDVVYSADGKSIELYLDGVGVPVTAAQRALTLGLATMSHDFFEVIFLSGTTRARASWEIGQNAGIRGVERSGTTGVNYAYGTYATGGGGPVAVIFVGRKSDKTLLAIGHLTHVDRQVGTSVLATSKSVTFTVLPIITRVTAGTGGPTPQPGALTDANASFLLGTPGGNAGTIADSATTGRARWTPLGYEGVIYPMFNLPKFDSLPANAANNVILGRYQFFGALASSGTPNLRTSVINAGTDLAPAPEVIKRDPRFLEGGQTWYINTSRMDTATLVEFSSTFTADTAAFPSAVDIKFTVAQQSDGGIFSFVFQAPVYMVTKQGSTNGGPAPEVWYIRPGYGVPLYNLDNGVDAGGCVLMGVNVQAIDWLEIFTTGIGFTN